MDKILCNKENILIAMSFVLISVVNGPKDDECGQVSTRTVRPRPAHMSEVISTPDPEFTVFRGGETEYKFRCLGFCSNLAESILNGSIDVDKIVRGQAEAANLRKAAADFNDAVGEAGYQESLQLLLEFARKYNIDKNEKVRKILRGKGTIIA